MTTTYASYMQLVADLPRTINRVAEEPVVARETRYYRETIGSIKTVDDFMADSRLLNYALKAHGLEEMSYAKALIRKVLVEGTANDDSFANKLADSRYKDFAKTFDFAAMGETATSFERARQGTIDRYMRQTLEETAGEDNTGVRLALYFERKAPEIESYYEILADEALGQVVRTALGLPAEVAASDIDQQVKLFEDRFDLEDFKDPEKLGAFIARFTALWELENPSNATTEPAILLNPTSNVGISADLLMSFNTLKLGGR